MKIDNLIIYFMWPNRGRLFYYERHQKLGLELVIKLVGIRATREGGGAIGVEPGLRIVCQF